MKLSSINITDKGVTYIFSVRPTYHVAGTSYKYN